MTFKKGEREGKGKSKEGEMPGERIFSVSVSQLLLTAEAERRLKTGWLLLSHWHLLPEVHAYLLTFRCGPPIPTSSQ